MSRFGSAVQLATMLGFLGVGLAGIGLAHSVFAMQLGLAFQQTGAGMAVPALIAWAQTKFGFEHRGRGMGVWSSAFFLGQAISPQIVGRIATGAGTMQGAFLVTGLIALGAALAGLLVASRTQPQPAAA